jgi:hypothetical protein
MMPEVDGADARRRVRREMPLANIYLVLLTSLKAGAISSLVLKRA